MAVGRQSPRKMRGFYYRVRPNTALWVGRIIAALPLGIIVLDIVWFAGLPFVTGVFWDTFSSGLVVLCLIALVVCLFLRAGVLQSDKRWHMDEFDRMRVAKSRLFAYRCLTLSLILIVFASPAIKGAYDGASDALAVAVGEVGIGQEAGKAELEAWLVDSGLFWLVIIAITFAPAYYHWTLKLVPAEENIRPDPPFKAVAHLEENE